MHGDIHTQGHTNTHAHTTCAYYSDVPGRGCCPGSMVTSELVVVFDNCDNVVVLSLGT